MPSFNPAGEEFLVVARQGIEASGAVDALDSLGWWDLLTHLDDPEMRMAVFAFFRAQGGALGNSSALGGLLAQPFLTAVGLAPGDAVATILRDRRRADPIHVVVGDPAGKPLLIDLPGRGAALIDLDQVELHSIDIPGYLQLSHTQVQSAARRTTIPEELAVSARIRSLTLGRLAIAMEILGAAERVLEIATEYATDRDQFGRPIGSFQAVRHLLAWGRTDCIAIEAVAHNAIRLDEAAPPDFIHVLKALAGRNGRRTCERSLQVLGGIGFTTEHDHHHFHSRILALDALLGTSAELTYQLGANLRETGVHPGFPAAVLLPASGS